jgi:hypothetical protein
MKRVLGILITVAVIAILLFMVVSSPKNKLTEGAVKPELVLNRIKVVKEQDRNGDELYLTLSARVAGESTEYMRIPAKPDHWLSRQIDLVTNVSLWSEPIADGQSITLVIELNEQDAEPLNPDDLLGIMRVQLKNEKGSLTVHWDIPNRTGIDAPKKLAGQVADTFSQESGKIEKFDLDNDGAHYEVYLSVKK